MKTDFVKRGLFDDYLVCIKNIRFAQEIFLRQVETVHLYHRTVHGVSHNFFDVEITLIVQIYERLTIL